MGCLGPAGQFLGTLVPLQLGISWVCSHLKALLAGCRDGLLTWLTVAGCGLGLWAAVPIHGLSMWLELLTGVWGHLRESFPKDLIRSCEAPYDPAPEVPECHFFCILLVK